MPTASEKQRRSLTAQGREDVAHECNAPDTTTQEVMTQLRRIARLAAVKVTEARHAVPDFADHHLGEIEVVLDDVEERLDELFD